jgi:hypothetical protein
MERIKYCLTYCGPACDCEASEDFMINDKPPANIKPGQNNGELAARLANALFDNAGARARLGPAIRIAFMHGKYREEKMGCGMGRAALALFLKQELDSAETDGQPSGH